MAFGFLDDIGGLGGLVDIGKAGVGIAGLFGAFGGNDNYGKKAYKDTYRLQQALINPQDPTFLNLYGDEKNRISASFAEGLRDLMVANRRATARGTNILNPERRDEAIASATANMRAGLDSTARDRARAYLAQAMGVNLATPAYAADEASANSAANKTAGGILAFDALGGLLNGDPRQTININTGYQQRARPIISTTPGLRPSSPPRY